MTAHGLDPLAALEELVVELRALEVAGVIDEYDADGYDLAECLRNTTAALASPAAAEMRAAGIMREALEKAPEIAYHEAMVWGCGLDASKGIERGVKRCARDALAAASGKG